MEELRTYDVGPVDLYDLPFSISVGDLNPDFRLSEAYYWNGHIKASWIDGLGRKGSHGPVSINEVGLASIFKSENLEKVKEVFTCRNDHQKSLATWIFVNWTGNYSYLIVRNNQHDENFVLELLSIDLGLSDLSFSNIDELIDKLIDHNIIKSVPSIIIKDFLIFIMKMFGIEKDVSKLQLNDSVTMLSKDNKVVQIDSDKKSGYAHIRSWEHPFYGLFQVPKIIREKIEIARLDDRIAYYISSGYSELPPVKADKNVSLVTPSVRGEDKGDEENSSEKRVESDTLNSDVKKPKPINKKQLELYVLELLAKFDLIEINEDLHLYYNLGQTETDKIPTDLSRSIKQLNMELTLLAGFNFKLKHDHYYLIAREGIIHCRKENTDWEIVPSIISADEIFGVVFLGDPVKTKDAIVLKMYWSSISRSIEHNLSNYYFYLDANNGEISKKKILL